MLNVEKGRFMNHKRRICELIDIAKESDIVDFKEEDFELVGYDPHPTIKGVVSV